MICKPLLGPLALTGLLTLGACGGGGGDSAPATPAAPTGVGITGTAATGAPIVGGAVSVGCATGSGQATTAANGSYSVTIASGVAPCLVQVTDGSTTYYSMVAAGSANPSTVNLTPLTTLMTAQVLGADPASATLTPDVQARLTADNVARARSALTAALNGRVDISGFDPIATAFAVGDSTDQLLDDFGAALVAAQLTLADLAAALVANPGSPAAIQTALAPAASSCPGLRTLPVVFVGLGGFTTATVDSATLAVTYDGNVLPPATLTDLGNCRFGSTSGSTSLVSASSVSAIRVPAGGGNFAMAFGIPRQELPLSALAGTWNFVAYISDNGAPFGPAHGSVVLDGAGRFTAFSGCTGFNDCESEAPLPTDVLTPVAAADGGGFVEGGTLNRYFAYRAPSGTMMMFVAIDSQDGVNELGFAVAVKQSSLELPAVDQVTPFSQFSINGTGLAGAISNDVSTVTAVDAANDSFMRTLLSGVAQTFAFNAPRDGMSFRAAGSSPDSNGMQVSFPATVQLRAPDTGLVFSISAAAAQNFFTASVTTPAPAAP